MKSYLKSFLLVSIILVLVIFLNACSALDKEEDLTSETEKEMLTKEISEEKEWKTFQNDALGIKFQYPEEWGSPEFEPVSVVTNLQKIKDEGKATGAVHNTVYKDSIYQYFNGRNLPILNYYSADYQGDIGDDFLALREKKDICVYYHFDGKEELSDECQDGVKTSYRSWQSDFSDEAKYRYFVVLYAYLELQNEVFDDLIISFNLGETPDIADGYSLEQYKTREDLKIPYDEAIEDFSRFVDSMEAFEPISVTEPVFQEKEEDSNITAIRRYYHLIATGKLKEAHDMKVKKPGIGTFTEWYQDTFVADPYSFEKIKDPNQYQFLVRFQDHNDYEQQFRVVMEVEENGELKTISSEELVEDVSFDENLSAFTKKRLKKNALILVEDGEEYLVDERGGVFEYWNGPYLSDPQFSPTGNYLLYEILNWEWFNANVYDVKNKKMTLELEASPFLYGFTSDEKNFYACSNDRFAGSTYARAYSVPDFKILYDIYSVNPKNLVDYLYLSCEYDEKENVMFFTLFHDADFWGTNEIIGEKKIVEYSFETGEDSLVYE